MDPIDTSRMIWQIVSTVAVAFTTGLITGAIVSKLYIRRWRRDLREGRYPCRHDVESVEMRKQEMLERMGTRLLDDG